MGSFFVANKGSNMLATLHYKHLNIPSIPVKYIDMLSIFRLFVFSISPPAMITLD